MISISNLNFMVHSVNENINLYDGLYFIDMGPGWIFGNDKTSELGSIIIPPDSGGSFTKLVKFEDTHKVMGKVTTEFNYKFITGSLSLGSGHEWGQEKIFEQTLEYEDNELSTYVKIYAIANRYELMRVKNKKIIEHAIGHTGGGIWGKRLDFDSNTPIESNILEEPFEKSFITNGKSSRVKLFVPSASIPRYPFVYSNNLYQLSLNNTQSEVLCTLDSTINGIYRFKFTKEMCKEVIIYKSLDESFLEYVTSIDDFDLDEELIQLELQKNQKYLFRLIGCKTGNISIIGKLLSSTDIGINNSDLNMNNRAIFEISEAKLSSSLFVKRNNEFIGKEIFYGISIPLDPSISKKKLSIQGKNCFYEIKVYKDKKTSKHNLKYKKKNIDIKPGEYFIIGIECKNIESYDWSNESNGITLQIE